MTSLLPTRPPRTSTVDDKDAINKVPCALQFKLACTYFVWDSVVINVAEEMVFSTESTVRSIICTAPGACLTTY